MGWLDKNPLDKIVPVKVGAAGRRRLRRAFTPDEFQRLLAAAALEEHRRTYQVAAFSGFRRKELQQMERIDCDPTGDRPRWHVRPQLTKNGLGAELPMLPDCAAVLLPRWQSLPAGEPRCLVPHICTFKEHLKRAGIPRQDERGRWADFHSLRYTFCMWMSQRHPIEVVQRLMRHSTIKLTADLYNDLGLEDIGKTVWSLPPLCAPTAKDQKTEAQPGQEGAARGEDQQQSPSACDAGSGEQPGEIKGPFLSRSYRR
jgi:integrase